MKSRRPPSEIPRPPPADPPACCLLRGFGSPVGSLLFFIVPPFCSILCLCTLFLLNSSSPLSPFFFWISPLVSFYLSL